MTDEDHEFSNDFGNQQHYAWRIVNTLKNMMEIVTLENLRQKVNYFLNG